MVSVVKQSKKIANKNYIFSFFILFIIFTIIINPAKYTIAASYGLQVWVKVLIPALFPFFVLTKLFSSCDLVNDFSNLFAKPTKKLYGCPPVSSYIFFMSIITGYPVGAKMVGEYYEKKELTREEAVKTLSFCLNSGPMFIFGSVAIGLFNNFKMGLIMYFSHILSSILNGVIYRNYKIKYNVKTQTLNLNKNQPLNYRNKINFSDSISSSINSILLIGGAVCFSFVLIEFITSLKIFNFLILYLSKIGINIELSNAIFSGILEITKGTILLSTLPLHKMLILPLCTFIITFGGISTLLQAKAFVKDIISTKMLVLQKLTQAIISTVICMFLII